jgi:hypothetical protein
MSVRTPRCRELMGDIIPSKMYRTTLAPVLFGLGPQTLKAKILAGELPAPVPLTEGSRFEAWLGSQIIEHRERMKLVAEERVKALREAAAAPVQPAAPRKPVKTKKMKLVPPSRKAR